MADRPRPRVFVDTNVLFSGLYSQTGPPAQILRLHIQQRILIVLSRQVLRELARTIEAKLPMALPTLRTFLLNAPPEVVRDPSASEVHPLTETVNPLDAPVLAAAIATTADYLVSGDLRFLRQARRLETGVTLLSPRQLVDELKPDA